MEKMKGAWQIMSFKLSVYQLWNKGRNGIKLNSYFSFRKTWYFFFFWRMVATAVLVCFEKHSLLIEEPFMLKSPTYLMLVGLRWCNLWLCHGSPCHSLKYTGKLPLPVLTVALLCELGNRASIPVGFAAPAAFHKALRAGKHQGLLQLCPQPSEQVIVNNLIDFFFPCLLWIICEQMVIMN